MAVGVSPAFGFGKSPSPPQPGNTAVISDSLVSNLKCSTLSADTVLSSLQPDAFDPSRDIGVMNSADAIGLGHCWALAHAQRIVFYLGRWTQTPDVVPVNNNLGALSKMIGNRGDYGTVFQVTGDDNTYLNDDDSSDPAASLSHDINRDIDNYQVQRFFDPLNLGLLMGGPDRSKSDNAKTFAQIQDELKKNWLPMIVLRINDSAQHVVLVKTVQGPDSDGNYQMDIYDSNWEGEDQQMTYSSTAQEFTAPEYLMEALNFTDPVGVFVVDDGGMQDIVGTLLKYYTNVCAQASPSPSRN